MPGSRNPSQGGQGAGRILRWRARRGLGTLQPLLMADELVSGLLKDVDVRVVLALTSELSRQARTTHQSLPASAAMLSQGLTAAALMAALQKGDARVNLQVECDGPLRGFFVDGDTTGLLRGYTKNPLVAHLGAEGEYRWRPVLGNKGFISVLRRHWRRRVLPLLGGAGALRLRRGPGALLHPVRSGGHAAGAGAAAHRGQTAPPEPLGVVAGVLLQPLPNGDQRGLPGAQRAGARRTSTGRSRRTPRRVGPRCSRRCCPAGATWRSCPATRCASPARAAGSG